MVEQTSGLDVSAEHAPTTHPVEATVDLQEANTRLALLRDDLPTTITLGITHESPAKSSKKNLPVRFEVGEIVEDPTPDTHNPQATDNYRFINQALGENASVAGAEITNQIKGFIEDLQRDMEVRASGAMALIGRKQYLLQFDDEAGEVVVILAADVLK